MWILNDNCPQGVWPLVIVEKNAQGPMESFDHARLKPPRKNFQNVNFLATRVKSFHFEPFLDDDDLIRATGRLIEAPRPWGTKQRFISYSYNHITRLFIDHCHEICMQAGKHHVRNSYQKPQYIVRQSRTKLRSISFLVSNVPACVVKNYNPTRGVFLAAESQMLITTTILSKLSRLNSLDHPKLWNNERLKNGIIASSAVM